MKMMSSVCYHVLVCVLVGSLVWGNGWCKDSGSDCKDPCKCNGIDIQKPAKHLKFLNITAEGKYIFWLSMCDPIGCTFDQSDNTVPHTSAACQYIIDRAGWGVLGQVEDVTWNITSKTNFSVAYAGGDASDKGKVKRTLLIFQIGEDVKGTVASFMAEDDTQPNYHDYIFVVQVDSLDSSGAPVGYAGMVILLLLAIGIGAYFIIGAAVMYQVKGARGVEVIPNYLFWKSFPILIKDGVKFTFSPCIKKFNGGYEAL